jgi:hypothetical protein
MGPSVVSITMYTHHARFLPAPFESHEIGFWTVVNDPWVFYNVKYQTVGNDE